MSSFLPLMQLGSSINSIGKTEIQHDLYNGERSTPKPPASSRFASPSVTTPLAPPSPWQQFKPFGRKTQSAPNSPPTMNGGFQELRRPKGKRRVSDPGARSRSYEPKRSPFAGFTSYFSPRASPRVDTMSNSPLLHTVEEDSDEDPEQVNDSEPDDASSSTSIVYTSSPDVDALGISLFAPVLPQSTVEVPTACKQPLHQQAPLRATPPTKRLTFTPSPYRFVSTPDLTHDASPASFSSTPSSYSETSSPRTPSQDSIFSPDVRSNSPEMTDVSMDTPVLSPITVPTPQMKRTASFAEVFSNIHTPGSRTVYDATPNLSSSSASSAASSPTIGFAGKNVEIETEIEMLGLGIRNLADRMGMQPKKQMPSARFSPASDSKVLSPRLWSEQGDDGWVRRKTGFGVSAKRTHEGWSGSTVGLGVSVI